MVLDAMRSHPGAIGLQRQGCLALRNLVARSPEELRKPLLDAGAEDVLRAASMSSQDNVDVAYAALRDLGVDISIKTFVPDGDSVKIIEKARFGDGEKRNFNHTFDESGDVLAGIQSAADETDPQQLISNFSTF